MPVSELLDTCFTTFLVILGIKSFYLAAFSWLQHVRSTMGILQVGTWKAMPVNFPFSSGVTWPTAVAVPVDAGMIFWAAPQPSRHSISEAIYSVLGGNDGVDCGRESFHNARVVIMTLAGGLNNWWCRKHC